LLDRSDTQSNSVDGQVATASVHAWPTTLPASFISSAAAHSCTAHFKTPLAPKAERIIQESGNTPINNCHQIIYIAIRKLIQSNCLGNKSQQKYTDYGYRTNIHS
jgi:hypothetical protein